MRDRARKYVDSFVEIVRSTGGKIKLTPIRSPNLQAHVERVIQTIKREVLNAFCIVTNEHLDGILHTTQDWYNQRRGHSERSPPTASGRSFVSAETVYQRSGRLRLGTWRTLDIVPPRGLIVFKSGFRIDQEPGRFISTDAATLVNRPSGDSTGRPMRRSTTRV